MTRIILSKGRIIDPANQIDCIGSIFISDGKIISLFEKPADFQADQIINADRKIICPGLIDLSARFREPGQTQKADIESESLAAASAGITTLCNPPDTQPVIDTPAVAELISETAEHIGKTRVLPIGALTRGLEGNELSSMSALNKAGCIAFSNAQFPITNTLVLRRAMEYAATHDLLVIIRPEDPWLRNNGCAHEGVVSTRFGLPGIPDTAETIAISQSLALAEQTGCRIHLAQLSCARSVALLSEALNRQIPVSADVAIHQLFYSEQDVPAFDSHFHVIPPFRTEQDKQALRAGFSIGALNVVCSDHQPHDIDAKLGAFPATEPGISSLETMLPLVLKLNEEKVVSLSQGIALVTSNPAEVLRLNSGALTPGTAADICIFDPGLNWVVNNGTWRSQGKNTPYWNKPLKGRVTHTLQAGRIVFRLEE